MKGHEKVVEVLVNAEANKDLKRKVGDKYREKQFIIKVSTF